MTTLAQTVNFHNQTLTTLEKDSIQYVAMKPICDNIGLHWEGQRQRIERKEALNSTACMIKVVAEDGKNREMLCLPIEMLNGWLMGVDENRVKPEIKDTLVMYQKECYKALYDYWHKGEAINPRRLSTVKDRNGLVKLCQWAAKKLVIDYSEACNMVNYRFNTKNFAELTCEQVEHACEYVQGLILEHGKSYQPITQPQVMTLPPVQNVTQGKFIGAFDEHGRMAMRQLGDNEFVTRWEDLPQQIEESYGFENIHTFAEIINAVSKRIGSLTLNQAVSRYNYKEAV